MLLLAWPARKSHYCVYVCACVGVGVDVGVGVCVCMCVYENLGVDYSIF